VQSESVADFVWAGVAFACTALTRPVFVLLPFALVSVGLLGAWSDRRRAGRWLVMGAAAVVALAPWFGYTHHYFHKFTISPAGGIGRATWEGTWQGVWPGRVHSELTDIADRDADRTALDRDVRAAATRSGLPAAPMLEYTHQWQDIRRIWTEPTSPLERASARIEADQRYWDVGVQNISRDPGAWVTRRLTRGVFALWTSDIPVRYTQINQLPRGAIYAMWGAQVILAGLAVIGLAALWTAGRRLEAALLATVLVYVTAVHFPLLTEVRQSLPAKPVLLALATIGAFQVARAASPNNRQQRTLDENQRIDLTGTNGDDQRRRDPRGQMTSPQ
jgi:hypothetical protein